VEGFGEVIPPVMEDIRYVGDRGVKLKIFTLEL